MSLADAPSLWRAPRCTNTLAAHVEIPGSKSVMARELILSALADQPSHLARPLRSRDSLLMRYAIEALGATVSEKDSGWTITPGLTTGTVAIDCGLSGTLMRFAPGLAALREGRTTFDGDPAARNRPMGVLLDGLRQAGVAIEDAQRGLLPFDISGTGSVTGGVVDIDGSASSQFVTGMLLPAARFDRGITLRHFGEKLPSLPHVGMTVDALRRRGVQVDTSVPFQWAVAPGTVNGLELTVEPDLSNAAPFLAAALVTGGTVTIADWPSHTTQPGDALRSILPQLGAAVSLAENGLTVRGGTITGADLDLSAVGELTPVIAAICMFADGPSTLRGVGHIRGHETDRLKALATELSALGGSVRDTEDGLQIDPRPLHSGRFATYGDHRLAHAAAVMGLTVDGIEIENIETTAKTMPDFAARWSEMATGSSHGAPVVSELAS